MLRSRSAFIVAAASAAGHCGPAAAVVCDELVKDMGGLEGHTEGMSEREIFEARARAAVRAQKKASRKAWALPRVSLRGVVGGIWVRRPRMAA